MIHILALHIRVSRIPQHLLSSSSIMTSDIYSVSIISYHLIISSNISTVHIPHPVHTLLAAVAAVHIVAVAVVAVVVPVPAALVVVRTYYPLLHLPLAAVVVVAVALEVVPVAASHHPAVPPLVGLEPVASD